MDGKDLHVGDFGYGILPASAPLAIGTLTLAGMALAFQREGSGRVAISFIGEGGVVARRVARGDQPVRGTEAARGVLPREQPDRVVDAGARAGGRARVRGQGRGLRHSRHHDRRHGCRTRSPRLFAWAVERARAGLGPALIELVAMRMCGHAHHDDMLYLGRDTPPSWQYPQPVDPGLRGARGLRLLVGVRSDRPVCRASAGRRRPPRGRTGPMEDARSPRWSSARRRR